MRAYVICYPSWDFDSNCFRTLFFSGRVGASGRLIRNTWSLSLDDAVRFCDDSIFSYVFNRLSKCHLSARWFVLEEES